MLRALENIQVSVEEAHEDIQAIAARGDTNI